MINNNSILLIDTKFDPTNVESCILLVKVGYDSFSYAIVNKETKQVIALYNEQNCNGEQRFTDCLKTDSYLSLAYAEVKIAVCTNNSIAVPNILFNEKELAHHTQFFNAPHGDKYYLNPQAHFGFTTIFALSSNMDQIIADYFAGGKVYSENAGLLTWAENLTEKAIILDFTANSFHVIYTENKQLVLQQTYPIENIDEFNYYLLLIINQLQIDSQTTAVNLTGIVHQGDERYHCISKYFDNINFILPEQDFTLAVLDDMPQHYYNSILTLYACE